MIDRNYHTYEERITAEKKEREQRNAIGKGILVVLLTLFIIWFIFGFLGSFFAKSPERISHDNSTESEQTIIRPRELNPTSPTPYIDKGTRLPLSHEQNSLEKKIKPNIDQGVKFPQMHDSTKI
ncbi:hypothetical protein [Bartonella phoceensis]|uniref:hypothetical protein n=1 Tax=Bartonella phoceensis TaxID=270249 RepID=UPI001ABBC8F1|nr:hypothetical protein [Bartonella phoceensis]